MSNYQGIQENSRYLARMSDGNGFFCKKEFVTFSREERKRSVFSDTEINNGETII